MINSSVLKNSSIIVNSTSSTSTLCGANNSNNAWFSYVSIGWVSTVLVILGTAGNIYSLLMLNRFLIAPALKIYLRALAVWDALLLVSGFGYLSLPMLVFGEAPRCSSYARVQQAFHPLSNLAQTASIWLVILITVERHSAVSDPIRHRSKSRCRRSQLRCMIASFAAALFCIPTLLEVEVINSEWCGVLTKCVEMSILRNDKLYQLIYRFVLQLIFSSLCPFLLILVLSVHIICILKKNRHEPFIRRQYSSRHEQHLHRQQANERIATIMLMLVIVKFLVCYFPAVLNALEIFDANHRHWRVFNYLVDVSNVLVMLNSATNWIIYFHNRHVLTTLGSAAITSAQLSPFGTMEHIPLHTSPHYTSAQPHPVSQYLLH